MRRNGAFETHVGKVQSGDSLPAPAARDPNPAAQVCCCGPVSSQESLVWTGGDVRFEGKES
jgi:hypothetical protein